MMNLDRESGCDASEAQASVTMASLTWTRKVLSGGLAISFITSSSYVIVMFVYQGLFIPNLRNVSEMSKNLANDKDLK